MLLANLKKLCLQQCCAKTYLLSCQPGLYVCLPGSLSGALVNLEVVIRSVVDDEDRLWWQMRNQFLLDPLEVVYIYLIVVVSSTWSSLLNQLSFFEESRLWTGMQNDKSLPSREWGLWTKITLLTIYLRSRFSVYRLFLNTHFRQLTFS